MDLLDGCRLGPCRAHASWTGWRPQSRSADGADAGANPFARLCRPGPIGEDRERRVIRQEEKHVSDTAVRTPQQVFDHHVQALVARDLEGIVEDYADDAVFIAPDGVLRGGGIPAFRRVLDDLPDAELAVGDRPSSRTTCSSSSGRARTARSRVEDGIDTFIFRDGRIRLPRPCATRCMQLEAGDARRRPTGRPARRHVRGAVPM